MKKAGAFSDRLLEMDADDLFLADLRLSQVVMLLLNRQRTLRKEIDRREMKKPAKRRRTVEELIEHYERERRGQ